jgi:hypothetical protein
MVLSLSKATHLLPGGGPSPKRACTSSAERTRTVRSTATSNGAPDQLCTCIVAMNVTWPASRDFTCHSPSCIAWGVCHDPIPNGAPGGK